MPLHSKMLHSAAICYDYRKQLTLLQNLAKFTEKNFNIAAQFVSLRNLDNPPKL